MKDRNKKWLEEIRQKYTLQFEVNKSGYKVRLIIMVKGYPKAIKRSSTLGLDEVIDDLRRAYVMFSEEEVENKFGVL